MGEMVPCPPADPDPRPPAFTPPEGCCDSHIHVFEAARWPYTPSRGYTPPDAPMAALQHLHARLGVQRAVITHASVHGADPTAVLDCASQDLTRYRAVVAVGADVTRSDIARMHALGARGMRVNLVDKGGMPFRSLDDLKPVAMLAADFGWHVEFLVHIDEADDLWTFARALPTDVVLGHLGYMPARHGARHPAFRALLQELERGRTWVKLTGPYRLSDEPDLPYTDVAPFAHGLLAARPDRIVWGSDWPHVMCRKPMPNDGGLMDLLNGWLPSEEARRMVLAENPARLYGFSG